jgi:L-2-hydroxyglutarate oxidase
MPYDFCTGGRIVGLATAMELLRLRPDAGVVLDKERQVGRHRTGHNSGVIHGSVVTDVSFPH